MNYDIVELLYRIKENVKAIENGNVSQAILKEIEEDFLQMMELLKLFLISERDSYYGYFLMNMQFRVSFGSKSIAGIKLNEFPPVFEANPLLLSKFTLKEIVYITCHEVDHVLLNHPAEMLKANPTRDEQTFYEFNLAADASVNDRINHEIVTEKRKFMAEPEGLITSVSLAKMYRIGNIRELENYSYYFELIKGKKNRQSSGSSGVNGQQSMMNSKKRQEGSNVVKGNESSLFDFGDNDNGSGNDSQEGSGERGNGNSKEEALEQDIVTVNDVGDGIQDHDWGEMEDQEAMQAAVKNLVNSVTEMMSSETRGMMPAHFESAVNKVNEPPQISWKSILKKYVGTISSSKQKTRTRLNRRQPERFDLSGARDDKVLKIVVAIDTSGSVSDRMIARIFNEIFEILAKRKHEITVIECDAEVNRVYKAKNASDIKLKICGRGGTYFTPAINYVNEHKEYRDALFIYFTDGYGENEIPRPRTYRNIWVVFGKEDNLSLKEPYGIVLRMDE